MNDIGKFTISLDTEIAWGRIAAPDRNDFLPQFRRTREVIDRLLDLFDRHECPVTWALVGRLIDPAREVAGGEFPCLSDYFGPSASESCYDDPVLTPPGNSFLQYPEVVEAIRGRAVNHELASHSYNHFFFGETTDASLVRHDFDAMEAVCKTHGFTPRSLVFPKNQVAHLDIVSSAGIAVYRGPDKCWYSNMSDPARKVLRQLDYSLPIPVSAVSASRDQYGSIVLPGSMVFRREHRGLRRYLPMSLLSAKARGGLYRAARSGGTVHLWFHPFNFGYRTEAHFRELEKVLTTVNMLREKGRVQIMTMSDYYPDGDAVPASKEPPHVS